MTETEFLECSLSFSVPLLSHCLSHCPSHSLPLRDHTLWSVIPLLINFPFDSKFGVCVEFFLCSLPKDSLLFWVQGLVFPHHVGEIFPVLHHIHTHIHACMHTYVHERMQDIITVLKGRCEDYMRKCVRGSMDN